MADIIQWVNVDPNDNNHRNVPGVGTLPKIRCGKQITFRAKINRRKRGKRVYWGVQLGADNVANNVGANAGWAFQAGKGGFSAPGFYEKLVPTNRKGLSITTFDLSECGGDEFTVKAYTKKKNGKVRKELMSEKYVVWRQLFYQVTRMNASVGNQNLPVIANVNWSNIKNEYTDTRKPHNIRWTEVPSANPLITRYRSLFTDRMIKDTGLEGYDRSKEPNVLKVSLVDMLAEKGQETHTFDVVAANETYIADLSDILFDMNSVDDRDDWFVSVTAHRKDHPSRAIPVTRNNFTKTGSAQISVRLNNIPKRSIVDFCRKATVTVDLNIFENWTLGFSWYNGIWINDACAEWGSPMTIASETASNKEATTVHEFGHAIGMVMSAAPFYYPTSHEHVGPHCWNGATDSSTFPAADLFPSPTGATCTMFGDNSSNTEKFCDDCSPFVRSCKPASDGKFSAGDMMPVGW